MKKNFLLKTAIFAGVFLTIFVFGQKASAQTFGPNLFENPGLEDWISDNDLAVWDEGETEPGGLLQREANIKHSGNYSAKFMTAPTEGSKFIAQLKSDLTPGDHYRVAFWARKEAEGAVAFVVYNGRPGEYTQAFNFTKKQWENNTGAPTDEQVEIFSPQAANNFEEFVSSYFTVPENGVLYLIFLAVGSSQVVYLDDLALNSISTEDITAPESTASPSSGAYHSIQTVHLSAKDNEGGSGVDKIYYAAYPTLEALDDLVIMSLIYTSPIKITRDTTLKFFATDLAGNKESVNTEKYAIKKAKFVTRKAKLHEAKIKKRNYYFANDFVFLFEKLPRELERKKYYLEIQRIKKYPPSSSAQKTSLKKYWKIKTNLNEYQGREDFKAVFVFEYSRREFKNLKKRSETWTRTIFDNLFEIQKRSKIREGDLRLKYKNPITQSWDNLPARHDREDNTFEITIYDFFGSALSFAIGKK